jgi:DNA-binding transcriptional regulator YhcF (GntR family)
MPNKRFLKLLHARKPCPLSFNERLTYSLLVFLSRQARTLSGRRLAERAHLGRNCVRRVIKGLARHGLLDGRGAVKPPPPGWFAHRTGTPCANWQDGFAYLAVPLVRANLRPHQAALYGLLVNKERDGRAALPVGQASRLLGVSRRTVRRALALLEGHGLVETRPRGTVVAVYRPSAQQLSWFQDAAPPSRKKAPPVADDKPWEGMSEQEIAEWVSDPDVGEYGRFLRRARYRGHYSTEEMDAVKNLAGAVRAASGGLATAERLFAEAEKEHGRSQGQGKYMATNSFPLFAWKLKEFLNAHKPV